MDTCDGGALGCIVHSSPWDYHMGTPTNVCVHVKLSGVEHVHDESGRRRYIGEVAGLRCACKE